ncbi:Potassium-transporting ATPase potassium-binding subunit [Streptomyces microflavus]
MSPLLAGLLQLLALVAALALAYRPLGDHMARVYTSTRHLRAERWIYRAIGADPSAEMRWPAYLRAVLALSLVGVLLLYALQRAQGALPGSLGFHSIDPDQAFNTAASFVTNTNWQSYAGEQAMGPLVQTGGLAVQNFVSAAVGMAVAIALVRGFARSRTGELGNFWTDLVRGTVRVLLPISVVGALVLVACGAIQNFAGVHAVGQFMGGAQQWSGGAVASQEAIKELGTNGGGYFNANSAHPFENPTPLTNLFEVFLHPAHPDRADPHLRPGGGLGEQGYAILATMAAIWLGFTALMMWTEFAHRGPAFEIAGGAMEGKETRFGVGRLVDLRGRHHADLDRRGELLPLLVHRLRRRHHDAGHATRRDRARRGRLRSLRHAGHGGHRGLHRRTDGRPDPGVPGQEDRRPADQARRPATSSITPALVLGLHRRGHGPAHPRRLDDERGAARLLRDPLRLHLGREQQRLGLRRAGRRHPLVQHHASASRCCSAASSRSSSSWPWPGHWPNSDRCPPPPAP